MNPMNRSYHVLVVLFLALLPLAPARAATPAGQAAADQVSPANLQTLLDVWLYTHTGHNRGMGGPQHNPARDNIKALFESYGLPTHLETFSASGQPGDNVVAELKGTLYPGRVYVVGAHYDSANNPGADDNASGVALTLEAARILAKYSSDCTIRFIAFDMEEWGLIGSTYYVGQHKSDDIRGMVSADMVSYDPGTNHCDIFGRTSSAQVKSALASAATEYGELICELYGPLDASNHAPFEWQGFQACLLIEDADNPWYHTALDCYDTPGYLNFEYAAKMTRGVVGWLVDAAGVQVAAAGDLNCDGTIDAFDIDPFVLALTDPAGYQAAWPECDWMLADVNDDGAVDAFDIDPFVALLTGG